VDQIYRAEFDVAYREGGLYVLTMHPHYTGHRSRVLWLEKLITYMKSKPGVWFATHEEIAGYLKSLRFSAADRFPSSPPHTLGSGRQTPGGWHGGRGGLRLIFGDNLPVPVPF
jgi:hypothetical protein